MLISNIEKKIIKSPSQLADIIKKIDRSKKRIVMCSGCFDILHSGHAVFFSQCKKFGDLTFVVIGRDENIRKLKGPDRPVNPENNRAFLLASLSDVNYVIFGEKDYIQGKIDFYNAMKKLKPDFFILNDNDSAIKEKTELCQKFGIKIKLVKRIVPRHLKQTSSSEIKNTIDKLYFL